MKTILCFLLPGILLLLPGCGPKVYEAPNMASVTRNHQLIAIAPPMVAIKGRPKDDQAQLDAAAREDTYTFQRELYSWMLRRKQQGKIRNLEIMDPQTTNAKLERAGYTLDNRNLTPAEMAEALGVDAVITTRFNTSKPMSQGAAIALGVLAGVAGTTNATTVNMDVHDAQAGMVWNYDWEASGGVFNKPEDLIEDLMRNASKRMPYTIN
ncbi:hypothetical protein GGR26_002294 [Lewinella marina]|uniref:DUF3313 domain-containing protein n=1 Tax=Neolewinella marina TaxID=438751 RepID=A0A2G0CGH0_9BACT|nr:hypothetical protein [Neolewinella marina]NJB86526.1 hypothetical protein [Neolewinella marina]PHK99020.1 hypothetical protein CGL56_06040 [Neolewinella marina]